MKNLNLIPRGVRAGDNPLGYRFDVSRDPQDQVWALGCSCTYGLWLEPEQTWAHQLGIMNFAQPGVGPDFLWINLSRLLSNYRPKHVVIQWPDVNRMFDHGTNLEVGTWSFERFPYFADLVQKGLVRRYNRAIVNMTRSRLQFEGIPYTEFRLDSDWYWYDPIPRFPSDYGAVDKRHPGPLFHKRIAQWLAPKLGVEQ